jgi:peptide-methionine (S)-S-oxide reductase
MTIHFDRSRGLRRSLSLAAALLLLASGPARAAAPPAASHSQVAVLAGGCFWGMEDVFEKLQGVSTVVAGYSGGSASTANYDTVSMGTTGHAESVEITYDPARISYATLLDVYFRVAHDPTEKDRQGPDDGTQYRSSIFYGNEAQHRVALAEIASLSRAKVFAHAIVTDVVPLTAFYPAEAYHQHFADRNPTYPYIVAIDEPKIVALRAAFPKLLKSTSSPAT